MSISQTLKQVFGTPLMLGACLILTVLFAGAASAQLNYADSNGSRAFTAITPPASQIVDLSITSGMSAVISPAGFSFNFAGTTYSDFVIMRHGFLSLGFVSAPSTSTFYEAAIRHPLISPYGTGLLNYGTASEIGWDFQGGVLTVQWLNLLDEELVWGSGNPAVLSFQALLDTTTGAIEFAYGPISGGPFKPRNWGDIVAILDVETPNGRVSRTSPMAGFIDAEGATSAWPADSFVRFDPTGGTRSAPQVIVTVRGTNILHQSAAVVERGAQMSNIGLFIDVLDADGDPAFVNATVRLWGSANVLPSEFSSTSIPVPYQIHPTTGSLPDSSSISVTLRVHDGLDGIRTLVFYVRTQSSPPPSSSGSAFDLGPVGEILVTIVGAGLKGGCVAGAGVPCASVLALAGLALLAALRRRFIA